MRIQPPRDDGRRAGFSLVETLVGLALLGLVLTMALAVTYRLPRHLERLAARREADRAAEAVLEAVRAGALPLVPGRRELPAAPAASPERALRTWLEVSPTDIPALYSVAVQLEYRVLGEPRRRSVETLAWRP